MMHVVATNSSPRMDKGNTALRRCTIMSSLNISFFFGL
jgi:hypothetical protein